MIPVAAKATFGHMRHFPGKELVRPLVLATTRFRAKCAFVLSTGRAGTETLTHLLRLSPDVSAFHEPSPEFLSESQSAYQDHPLPRRKAMHLARHYCNARLFSDRKATDFGRCCISGRLYVECSNRLTYVAPALAQYFPEARFILLHRHPAEVVRSAMRRRFYTGSRLDSYRIVPRHNDQFCANWSAWSRFEKCCWYWQAVNQFALDFLQTLSDDTYRVLPSRALFQPDMPRIQSLFEWLGTAPPSDTEAQGLLSQPRNAQVDGTFCQYAHWSTQQRKTLASIVGPVATALGYQV
jgi:hypothetical protein